MKFIVYIHSLSIINFLSINKKIYNFCNFYISLPHSGTPLQFVNREKSSSACRSISDSIKKHIFHKSLHKTPKRGETHVQTPASSSANVARTPLTAQVSKKYRNISSTCIRRLNKLNFR